MQGAKLLLSFIFTRDFFFFQSYATIKCGLKEPGAKAGSEFLQPGGDTGLESRAPGWSAAGAQT